MPVTLPEASTVPAAPEALHTPPAVASDSTNTDPAHTGALPVIVPALGERPTVTTVVAATVPHTFVTV